MHLQGQWRYLPQPDAEREARPNLRDVMLRAESDSAQYGHLQLIPHRALISCGERRAFGTQHAYRLAPGKPL